MFLWNTWLTANIPDQSTYCSSHNMGESKRMEKNWVSFRQNSDLQNRKALWYAVNNCLVALNLRYWLIPVFKSFMPHSASSYNLWLGPLHPPFFVVLHKLPTFGEMVPFLHLVQEVSAPDALSPLGCTGNSAILSVWYISVALMVYRLLPGPRVWLKAWKRGRDRNPCQCSLSEGVVNAPDSLKLIWQEELEIAQTDLSLCSLRKHRSTPKPSLSNTVYLNRTTCVKQHSFKPIILLTWNSPLLGQKYSTLIAAAKQIQNHSRSYIISSIISVTFQPWLRSLQRCAQRFPQVTDWGRWSAPLGPNQTSPPKPPPGCPELLLLHLACPLPRTRLVWCPCLAESCPSMVIARRDSFCADLVFWNRTPLCSWRCRSWGCARKLQERGKQNQHKLKGRRKKKSLLVQHLLSHRIFFFPSVLFSWNIITYYTRKLHRKSARWIICYTMVSIIPLKFWEAQ